MKNKEPLTDEKVLAGIDARIDEGTASDEDIEFLTDHFIGFMEELQNEERTDVLPINKCHKKANDTGTA